MSQFFISCKESRIENNRSFYGCFYLGPFEPSQSVTIANSLRRTLLSEIYGLGIISVEIDGATHEYSSLPGIRESVLDILLNLKEIVLKKTIKNFKPQIGYLRVRGPGIVRASHLRLPSFIQSVDPDQYIATLSENGFLNLKFIIQYGNKWADSGQLVETNQNSNNPFNSHLKKRRLILKKLEKISSEKDSFIKKNQYLKMFSDSHSLLSNFSKKKQHLRKKFIRNSLLIKKYPAINFKTGIFRKDHFADLMTLNKTSKNIRKKMIFLNSKPLIIDAIFNPINKVNYIIQTNDFKEAPSKLEASKEASELYQMLNTASDSIINSKFDQNKFQNEENANYSKNNLSKSFSKQIVPSEMETILDLKREINSLKKESIKHNITLEIWTNGSIHPRDALNNAFKNLIKIFGQLEKVNSFGIQNCSSDSLVTIQKKLKNLSNSDFEQNLTKKNKMKTINPPLFSELMPLNENAFLNTYMDPIVRNYYLKNQSLSKLIKNLKNQEIKNVIGPKINQKKGSDFSIENNFSSKYYSNTDIGILNLSLRCYTGLKRIKINVIEDLIQLSKQDLIGKGEKNNYKLNQFALDEIQKSLKKLGLDFRVD